MTTLLDNPDVAVTAVVAIRVTACELGRSEPVIVGLVTAVARVVGVVGVETAVPSTGMVDVVGVETAVSTTGVPVVTVVVRTVPLVSRALVESIIALCTHSLKVSASLISFSTSSLSTNSNISLLTVSIFSWRASLHCFSLVIIFPTSSVDSITS